MSLESSVFVVALNEMLRNFRTKKLLFDLTHEMELLPKVFWGMHSHHSSLPKTNSESTLTIGQGPREGNDDVIFQPSGQILATSHDLTPNDVFF